MNCDEANTNRQVDTSSRQLEAIRYIAATAGLGSLPDNLRLAAENAWRRLSFRLGAGRTDGTSDRQIRYESSLTTSGGDC